MPAAKGDGSEGGTPVTLRALRYPVSLRRPFEQPVDSAQLRRRVLVFAGMWFLLAGMLAALGLIAVLLVSVVLALIGTPLRRCPPCFKWVVTTRSTLPCHCPVENPIHVCGALGPGCGRPSIQTVRVCSNVLL